MKKLLCFLIVVLLMSFGLTSCGLTVPRPEVKKGEFDFTVTYEFNGELKTVSGVYVCEYGGIDWALDGGSHRDWVGYVRDGTTDECIKLATAEDGEEPIAPMFTVRLEDEEGLGFENDADLIAEVYGARIISYEYDEPIENTFG